MRLRALLFMACAFVLPAMASAQVNNAYSGRNAMPSATVIQPMPNPVWRNYVTVPDGPCGYPMAVQADCYNGCGCCFRPLVFLHRVKRMVDCLLPCNLCCRGGCGGGCGGCGPSHGCLLGGRTWGHCSVCCGGPVGGCGGAGCGGSSCGGCCTNPCGSAFAPTCGGHCHGCGCSTPAAGDLFIDDPLPPTSTPQPTAPQVRRGPVYRTQPTHFNEPSASTAAPQSSATKKISSAKSGTAAKVTVAEPEAVPAPIVTSASIPSKKSVLRRTSAEQDLREPAALFIDYPAPKPIVRSQTPEPASGNDVPFNPLRK